jgi:ferrous iron transport protein B
MTGTTDILQSARTLRQEVGAEFHDSLIEALYTDAAQIADRAVTQPDERPRFDLDHTIDRLVTSRTWGFPIMILLLTAVFWITIQGANVPSSLLAALLLDTIHPALNDLGATLGFPWWLSGVLFDGAYLSMAWVIAVMLPPMAIFFPLFTLLEDFGYLPRVAFNLDRLFSRAGAHGKQALSMTMGFGCNAAGVVATRVIDSPRERLIAIITNNFAVCNGRWPTLIMVSTIFVGGAVPAALAGLISAGAVVGIAVLGVLMTFVVSWFLSRTMLKGEASVFSLELPPYRPPRLWQTLYTSVIDRTVIVLWRAVIMAIPAGILIWTLANITLGDQSLAEHLVGGLDGIGLLLGLNGVILVAYLLAIPANEIVIPTVLMLTVLTAGLSGVGESAGVMFEPDSNTAIRDILEAGGWTGLTAINLMLFSLIHNPCSTTILTIYNETKSLKWTAVATLLPLALGVIVTFSTALVARLFGWI